MLTICLCLSFLLLGRSLFFSFRLLLSPALPLPLQFKPLAAPRRRQRTEPESSDSSDETSSDEEAGGEHAAEHDDDEDDEEEDDEEEDDEEGQEKTAEAQSLPAAPASGSVAEPQLWLPIPNESTNVSSYEYMETTAL